MKRLIIICTILAMSAMAVVSAQTITVAPAATKQEQIKAPETKAGVVSEQKTNQAAKANENAAAVKTAANKLSQDEQADKVVITEQPFNADGALSSERLGEHGPYLYDPDFAKKKAEWIKNYPEEYKNSQSQKTTTQPTK